MKGARDLFIAAMGSYDGVEVCKFVGTFSFEKIDKICNKNRIGLYRVTIYQFLETKNGTQLEKIKKTLQRLFKKYDLEITT